MAQDAARGGDGSLLRRVRGYAKMACLIVTLAEIALRFGLLKLRRGARLSLGERADFLQSSCRLVLRRIGFSLEFAGGTLPSRCLLVANHLSHLDILFFASAFRCIFVAKSEVRQWPAFGSLAQFGGTIFVERDHASTAVRATQQVEAALEQGVPVMVFAEGTSSDGTSVLPFRPLLFEPAVRAGVPVQAAWIRYTAEDAEERELCYYGDVSFAPHLLACLGLRGVRGAVGMAGAPVVHRSRKVAAAETWELVSRARAGASR